MFLVGNVIFEEGFLQLIQDNKRIIFKICNSYYRNNTDREDLAKTPHYLQGFKAPLLKK